MESSDASSPRTPQRIVFLVDLHPLHNLQNPNPYISSILSSFKTLISFHPLSSSLFAFKLFFSSLSPLLSTSKVLGLLGKPAAFISFNSPSQTLASLSHVLNSLSSLSPSSDATGNRVSPPRASLIAGSLRQISHDYAWEPEIQDLKGMPPLDFFAVRSNLVILFSPLARSLGHVCEFMDKEVGGVDAFHEEFIRIFGSVKDGFVSRDIHFCWVDVCFENDCDGERGGVGGCGFLERGIKGLGWGLCSSDAIVLGSALVPFGLIYPNIGSSMASRLANDYCNVGRAELSLQISDVNGRPLECKCCNLEVFDLKLLRGRTADLSWILDSKNSDAERCKKMESIWRGVGDGAAMIHVKEVWRADVEGAKIKDSASDIVLLRGPSREQTMDENKDKSSEFFVDKVLEMLQTDANEFTPGKPVWQLLLNFLHRERYWGLVSVSSVSSADSIMGILKPLTIHSAILYVFDGVSNDCDAISTSFCKSIDKKNDELYEAIGVLNRSEMFTNSQVVDSSCCKRSGTADGKRRRNKKYSNSLLDFSWNCFSKAVLNNSHEGTMYDIGPEINLEDLYFARSNSSKKLRFLKCWMKQMGRSSFGQRETDGEPKAQLDVKEEMEERAISSQQESEPSGSHSTSLGDTSPSGPANDETSMRPCLETPESFSQSISQKIQQSLDSEEVDLGFVAERLVNSCIHWVRTRHERDATESLISEKLGDTCDEVVASEVEKHLLRKPRDLVAKYRACNSSSSLASDWSSVIYTSANKVREHELQILFRMEILQSKIGTAIEGPAKQKMVKDICLLLENIEFNLQGGMFGGESLVEFAGRTIKTRYSPSLCDIINKIYAQMEFMTFEDEDQEASGSLPNSENSGEYRANEEENEIRGNADAGTTGISGNRNAVLTEDKSLHLRNSLHGARDMVQEQKLMEAQERRERARRFASFTSWGPDLRRVWAPKQPRMIKAKAEPFKKPSSRRKRSREHNDVVLETPMPGAKHRCLNEVDIKTGNYGINPCGSVSKALFQNDSDATASTIT